MVWAVSAEAPETPGVELQLHHGVYFKPLGEVIVTGSEWTICTTIDLGTYEAAHTSLQQQLSEVEEHMRNIPGEVSSIKVEMLHALRSMWDKLSGAFRQDLANYQRDIEVIKRVAIQNDARQSRGLINVVSNVGKYLFGFSTEKDTNKLSERINQLAAQGGRLTHLVDQQLSYIDSVSSQVLHNGEQINRLEASLGGMTFALGQLNNITNAVQLGAKFAGVGLEMLSAVEIIREGFTQSQGGLDTIRRIMAKAGEGTLAWELLEDPVFRDALLNLGSQLPTGWKLLYDANDHYSYLRYIATDTHRTPSGLNLCMAIPIVKDSGRYQLYEAIPMPIVHPEFPEKLFFSYHFETSYLAVQKTGSDYFTPQGGPGKFFTMDAHREAKCEGNEPRVCSLLGAVKAPSPDRNNCLYDLFTDSPTTETCPVQVQYQEGPVFQHVGLGVWLYGAAQGTLQVRCSGQSVQSESQLGQYKLTGTGAFRLQPGCEASLGQIKVPSYVNGRGQFKVDLPDAPIVNLFSLNFSRSLWSNLTSNLIAPDNITLFLKHLTMTSDIQKNAINLKAFNDTVHKYQTLRNQLPSYHPLVWTSQPENQVTMLVMLLLLNVITTGLLTWGLVKLRKKFTASMASTTPAVPERRELLRVRRRRRQTTDPVV